MGKVGDSAIDSISDVINSIDWNNVGKVTVIGMLIGGAFAVGGIGGGLTATSIVLGSAVISDEEKQK